MKKTKFNPKLLCFLCQWCGYNAADLAGTNRVSYPASVRTIEVTCSGMVHPNWIINALLGGIDGVMIVGCHKGQCHYGSGNEFAMLREELIRETMFDFGIEKDRFQMTWLSAAEAERFAETVTEMTAKLIHLGPNNVVISSDLFSVDKEYFAQKEKEFVQIINGKNYYWDGKIYKDNLDAQRAISKYLNAGFEAKIVPSGKGIFIYTRKEFKKDS